MNDNEIIDCLVKKIEQIEHNNGQDIFATEQNKGSKKNVVKAILEEVDKVIAYEN